MVKQSRSDPPIVALVIVAAGRGARAGTEGGPKQYRPLAGKTVLERTIGAFADIPEISCIQTVIHADDRALYEAACRNTDRRLLPPVVGGDTRQASVRAGLEALASATQIPERVLIHDAARPFVTSGCIRRVLAALEDVTGAIPGLAVTDTLKQAGKDALIARTLDRSGLWRAQTPQGFHFPTIVEAHRKAKLEGFCEATDDAAVLEWVGASVKLVDGDPHNVKLTTQDDLRHAEQTLLSTQDRHRPLAAAILPDVRVGHGFDVHAFGPGTHLTLCGVRIAHDKSLIGHSDADVAMHALTDAILGALGDGDIGTHFPPTDPAWKGLESGHFLRDALARVHERGARLTHADVTLVCELPKIGPYRSQMRSALGELLEIDAGRISVKATTSERLGFTGRGEGISALATATLVFPPSGDA